MKIFLAAFGGLVATLAVYASGFFTAMFFLSAEPTPVWKPSRDTASVWTLEPVVVSEAGEAFERLPSRQATDDSEASFPARAETVADDVELTFGPDQPIDATLAASIAAENPAEPVTEITSAMNTAHVQWCADRFRSYRVEDNSYNAYRGGRRECVSPFFNGGSAAREDGGSYADATNSAGVIGRLSPRHIQSCFDRYRSYRPEDNSYQPYSGGPRRQCR